MTVHILHYGQPLCGFSFESPVHWPKEHLWVSIERKDDATCYKCKARAENNLSRSDVDQERVRQLLTDTGAIIEGHFVGVSGNHFSVYIAKDRATRFPTVTSQLCRRIAKAFVEDTIDVVVAPAIGGIPLSQWTAHHLTQLNPEYAEVLALYTERSDTELRRGRGGRIILSRSPKFVLKRGFAEDVKGKRVLAVEDTLTTGDSAFQTTQAILREGGILVGLGALVKGGNVTAEVCGVPRLETLLNIDRKIYTKEECALCAQKIPLNTNYGHGADFLAHK